MDNNDFSRIRGITPDQNIYVLQPESARTMNARREMMREATHNGVRSKIGPDDYYEKRNDD